MRAGIPGLLIKFPTAPINTIAPVISGTQTIGGTLTAAPGTWTGFPTPVITGQWKRAGVAIPAATGTTYVQVAADIGPSITYVETATNSHSPAVNATSNALQYNPDTALSPKIKLHFNADVGLVPATGFSSWTDTISGYVASQATGSAQPTARTISGKAFVQFTAANSQKLVGTAALSTIFGAPGAFEITVVYQADTVTGGAGGNAQSFCSTSGSGVLGFGVATTGVSGFLFLSDSSAKNTTSATAPVAGTLYRARYWADAVAVIDAKNGSGGDGTTATALTQNSGNYAFPLQLGAFSTHFLNGAMRHIFMFNGVLTAGQRADLDAWITWDCGAQV